VSWGFDRGGVAEKKKKNVPSPLAEISPGGSVVRGGGTVLIPPCVEVLEGERPSLTVWEDQQVKKRSPGRPGRPNQG